MIDVRLVPAGIERPRLCVHSVKLGPENFCHDCTAPDMSAIVKRLLESYFWLPTLVSNTRYSRQHDDTDGNPHDGWLHVMIGEDGDAWILTTVGGESMRFRMPMIGGGRSQHTRTALVILAEAIRMDNEARPQW